MWHRKGQSSRYVHGPTGTCATLQEREDGTWQASIRYLSPARVKAHTGTYESAWRWMERHTTYGPTL